ncbi:MAG TPA: dihydropteroate synthase [Candidatus Thermoplasmatota archaeon]|nr:dihydropteroate synthase [Candidatus Thermoplasmatota archaeon]
MPELRLARGRRLRLDRPLVMGILNATPDSFSDGGELGTPLAVRERVQALVDAGADLLDVGGESTRPGHRAVPAAEEVTRVLPVLRELRRADAAIPVSIDTRKAEVARAALEAGADLVNDVGGLADPAMAGVVREASCSVVLMRSAPITGDLLPGCAAQLAALARHALAEGLPADAIVLDPGLGFGDPPGGDPAANLLLLRAAGTVGGGFPVLVGASRKRFLGRLTGIEEPRSRGLASAVAALLAAQGGAAVLRVHDVAETVQALRVAGLRPPP